MQMPVAFFIDPAIADDPEMDNVKTITLSYTFFPSKENAELDKASTKVRKIAQLGQGSGKLQGSVKLSEKTR